MAVADSTYVDNETRAILSGVALWSDAAQQRAMAAAARDRMEAFRIGVIRAGLGTAADIDRAIKAYDPSLQFRFDLESDCYVVDRWVENGQYWVSVLFWRDQDNRGLPLDIYAKFDILEKLDANNMQKGTAYEWRLKKRQAAAPIKAANKARGEEMVKEAVDSLSRRALGEFVDAHKAMATGEEIRVHGEDATRFERIHNASVDHERRQLNELDQHKSAS